jgi:hypothetical protein
MSLIDLSRIAPRDWLIIGVLMIVAFALWHEFILMPARVIDQLCERVTALDSDNSNEDIRTAIDEMAAICRNRRPIEE